METEEITKLVDGIYKNILEKFNPGARQLINAGKTYLKALHGAAAASKLYVEAINKLARQAQQGTWGGSSDIGSALLQIVEVYKEIQNQQMNILKAFYVDLLVPLETNLEKDTKVVQSEQKRFLQQHKQRSETYSKAAATMKKQRKKNKGTTKTGLAMDKEVKNMQVLEEERTKLDAFCEQSLKTAMTQERRRYGFVLERQCSLAKHYLAYHSQGTIVLQRHLDEWQEVAQTREYLPDNVDSIFTNRLRQVSFWPDEDVYSSPRSPNMEDDRLSIASQLRKTKSMDASCLDVRSINDVTSPLKPLSRAKSDFNLTASTHSLVPDQDTLTRPKSIAVERTGWDSPLARALYAYLSSGDNQLSFLEGDIISMLGERNKGWQFGENLRTQCSGWFPLAYTEMLLDEPGVSPTHQRGQSYDSGGSAGSDRTTTTPVTPSSGMHGNFSIPMSPSQSTSFMSPGGRQGKIVTALIETNRTSGITMFGDTLAHRSNLKQMVGRGRFSAGPPPLAPAPVPTPKVPSLTLPVTQRRLILPPPMPPLPTLLANATKRAPGVIGNVGNASLHSSNDSGFSNDPPPAPEVDYSDDDSARKSKAHRQRKSKKLTADDVTKSRLLSSVRGWLLYKSALDLWDDVNNQENSPDNNQSSTLTMPRHPVVRQSSSVGHLASLGRSEEELATSGDLTLKRNEPLTEKRSLEGGTKVKRSKSIWRFKKSAVDIGVIEGMSLWQHRSLVDVHATTENEPTKKDEKNKRNKGTPIMKTKLVPVKYSEDEEENDDIKEKYIKKSSPMLDRKEMENFLSQSKDDLDYEEVPSPEMTIKRLKAKLKRTDINDVDDDGLLSRHKISSSSFDYDSDVSMQGDTESCIVVNDHLRAATLKSNKHKNKDVGENGTLLPRTKLFMKYSLTLGSKSKSKSRDTINIGDGEGLMHYGKTLEKRMSKPERGSRFDQMSTTTGNMCGPWYDLWGADASVIKK